MLGLTMTCTSGGRVAFGLLLAISWGCVGDDPTDNPVDLCPQYCDAVLANCTGDDRAFENRPQCLKACGLMTQGKEGDTGVDTVGCRLSHAKIGKNKDECRKASAYGGDACGSHCDTFCAIVDANCIEPLAPGAGPYPSRSTCFEECTAITYEATGSEGTAQPLKGANTINCRMFHLLLSLDDREGHCPHTAKVSATCQ